MPATPRLIQVAWGSACYDCWVSCFACNSITCKGPARDMIVPMMFYNVKEGFIAVTGVQITCMPDVSRLAYDRKTQLGLTHMMIDWQCTQTTVQARAPSVTANAEAS